MLLCLPCALAVADEQISDIRIELGGYTTVLRREHLTIQAGSDSGYYTSEDTLATRDTDSGRGSFCLRYCQGSTTGGGGTIWDVALASYAGASSFTDDLNGTTVPLQDDIIELQFGLGYALSTGSWSHLEAMGDLGLGYIKADNVDLSQTDGSVQVTSGDGVEWSLGAHLGWVASLEQHVVVGLLISAAWHEGELRGDFSTGTTYHGRLGEVMLSYLFLVGIRF
jgi:hypothetical protein